MKLCPASLESEVTTLDVFSWITEIPPISSRWQSVSKANSSTFFNSPMQHNQEVLYSVIRMQKHVLLRFWFHKLHHIDY